MWSLALPIFTIMDAMVYRRSTNSVTLLPAIKGLVVACASSEAKGLASA